GPGGGPARAPPAVPARGAGPLGAPLGLPLEALDVGVELPQPLLPARVALGRVGVAPLRLCALRPERGELALEVLEPLVVVGGDDRKSTRLNSSHVKISYAVF